jgi:predicted RNase H-like nuclease (RuvC/YqgF family)
MSEIAATLEDKKRELRALKESRPTASCSRENSTEADVRREMEVEALEDEIRELQKRLSQGS